MVARALGTHAPAGGRAILVQHYRDLLPLSLYVPGLKFWRGGAPMRVREFDVVVVHVAGERRLLLVGVGVQPVAVAGAVRVSDRRFPGGVGAGTNCSSP